MIEKTVRLPDHSTGPKVQMVQYNRMDFGWDESFTRMDRANLTLLRYYLILRAGPTSSVFVLPTGKYAIDMVAIGPRVAYVTGFSGINKWVHICAPRRSYSYAREIYRKQGGTGSNHLDISIYRVASNERLEKISDTHRLVINGIEIKHAKDYFDYGEIYTGWNSINTHECGYFGCNSKLSGAERAKMMLLNF